MGAASAAAGVALVEQDQEQLDDSPQSQRQQLFLAARWRRRGGVRLGRLPEGGGPQGEGVDVQQRGCNRAEKGGRRGAVAARWTRRNQLVLDVNLDGGGGMEAEDRSPERALAGGHSGEHARAQRQDGQLVTHPMLRERLRHQPRPQGAAGAEGDVEQACRRPIPAQPRSAACPGGEWAPVPRGLALRTARALRNIALAGAEGRGAARRRRLRAADAQQQQHTTLSERDQRQERRAHRRRRGGRPHSLLTRSRRAGVAVQPSRQLVADLPPPLTRLAARLRPRASSQRVVGHLSARRREGHREQPAWADARPHQRGGVGPSVVGTAEQRAQRAERRRAEWGRRASARQAAEQSLQQTAVLQEQRGLGEQRRARDWHLPLRHRAGR
mmetsp:Transcript_26876/g.85484  ORF Transcript_26876/g.85484 Transcript_26876/m.85484 type:complete len:385 (+) Transcript_26876:633-1787(+)